MKVLQLFDVYLPSTLSWVDQMLNHLPKDVKIQTGAVWTTDGPALRQSAEHLINPLQLFLTPGLPQEFEAGRLYRLLGGIERYLNVYVRLLGKRLKNDPPDVLHAHFGPMGCHFLPLAWRLNRPLVVGFYGYDYSKVPAVLPRYRKAYRQMFRAAAAVVSCSRGEGVQRLIALGCPAEKIHPIWPAIDLSQYPFVQKRKCAETLKLVQLATLTPKKGHKTTIEALAIALRSRPNIHLTIAGEEPLPAYKTELLRLVDERGLSGHVGWQGFVPHHSVPALLAQFDAFMHPSCHTPDFDHEATPVAILEAAAVGLPVLSTHHWDIPYEVLHGKTGLLSAENDARALAAHILAVCDMSDEVYGSFRREARKHVEAHFDVRDAAAQFRALYQSLTETPAVKRLK